MDKAPDKDHAAEVTAKGTSVSASVLGEFFDALEKEEGLSAVAQRLRKTVLEDGVFAEPSIRAALFQEGS